MSDIPNKIDPSRNLPSSYQEILRMLKILLEEVVPFIQKLKDSMTPEPPPGDPGGDVIIDPDDDEELRVPGITVVKQYITYNLSPKEYLRNVVFEIKEAKAIGLAGKDGINLPYVTLMTIRQDARDADTTKINYPAWQCAYGDDRMAMWYRRATSDTTWGQWVRVTHKQVLESKTLPTTQEVGDYWFWPIEKGVDPLGGKPTGPTVPDGYFAVDLDTDERIDFPDTDHTYSFIVLPGESPDPDGDKDITADDLGPTVIPKPMSGYYLIDLSSGGTVEIDDIVNDTFFVTAPDGGLATDISKDDLFYFDGQKPETTAAYAMVDAANPENVTRLTDKELDQFDILDGATGAKVSVGEIEAEVH